jgi:hypothetical protein
MIRLLSFEHKGTRKIGVHDAKKNHVVDLSFLAKDMKEFLQTGKAVERAQEALAKADSIRFPFESVIVKAPM